MRSMLPEDISREKETLKIEQPFAYWWGNLSQHERNNYWHAIEIARKAFNAGRASKENSNG